MNYIYYIIMALAGGLFYFIRKSDALSGLMKNFKVTQQDAVRNDQIAKNDGLIAAEEIKRKAIEDEKTDDSNDDLVNFFDNNK